MTISHSTWVAGCGLTNVIVGRGFRVGTIPPLARKLRPLFPEMGATGPTESASTAPASTTPALPEPAFRLAALLHAAGTLASSHAAVR